MTASEWTWFGYPGHFILADRCRFHMHTHVGDFCVSTVGDLRDRRDSEKQDEVGFGRLFETKVFRLGADGKPISYLELEMEPYNNRDAAQSGHVALCRKYSEEGSSAEEFMRWLEAV